MSPRTKSLRWIFAILVALGAILFWRLSVGGHIENLEGIAPDFVLPSQPMARAEELPELESSRLEQDERAAAQPARSSPTTKATRDASDEPRTGVFGRVTTSDGHALEGCVITSMTFDGEFSMCTSNANGDYALDLSPEATYDGLLEQRKQEESERANAAPWKPELLLVATHSRGNRVERRIPLHAKIGAKLRVNFVISLEPPFGGQILVAEGSAFETDVFLFDREWTLLQTTRSDSAGMFKFRPPEAGIYRIHARKLAGGTSSLDGMTVGADVFPVQHTLALGGDHTLRGQVIYPNGDPAVGLEIFGVAVNLALQNPLRPLWPTPGQMAQYEESRGLGLSRASTDEEGRFWMRAMQQDSYMLLFDGLADDYQPNGLYSTGVEHKVIYHAHTLRVLVSGDPDIIRLARIHVVDRSPKDPVPPRQRRHAVKTPVRNMAEFVVDPDSMWGVSWEYEGRFSREKLVRIDSSTHVFTLKLNVFDDGRLRSPEEAKLPSIEGLARLDFELRDEKGQRIEARVSLWRLEGANRSSVHTRFPCDANHSLPELSPGLYDYRVEAVGDAATWSSPLENAKSIELQAAKTKQVKLSLVPAARLKLSLLADSDAVELPQACRAELHPTSKGVSVQEPTFLPSTAEAASSKWLALGESGTCDALFPAGKYELKLFDDAGLRGSISLTLVAGKLNEIAVPVGAVR